MAQGRPFAALRRRGAKDRRRPLGGQTEVGGGKKKEAFEAEKKGRASLVWQGGSGVEKAIAPLLESPQ